MSAGAKWAPKKQLNTANPLARIKWPAVWAPNEGWPDEGTPLTDEPGRTFGDLAPERGTTAEAMCMRLGKPTKTSKGDA